MQAKHIAKPLDKKQLRHMLTWGSARERRLATQLLDTMTKYEVVEKIRVKQARELAELKERLEREGFVVEGQDNE